MVGRLVRLFACTLLLVAAPLVAEPMTAQQARDEGKALGLTKRSDTALVPMREAQAEIVPGYAGTDLPQGFYFDEPDKLVADAHAAKDTSEPYAITTDTAHVRSTFSKAEIRATTDRAMQIEADPSAYLEGEAIGGSQGSCTPLPPGTGSGGFYEASCNSGTSVVETSPVCRTPLLVDVTPGTTRYVYTCEDWSTNRPDNSANRCVPAFNPAIASGICRERSRRVVQYPICRQGGPRNCTEPDVEEGDLITYECDSPAVSRSYTVETVGDAIHETRDETACRAATADQTCEITSEICVDGTPATRRINGVEVTRACWSWEQTYSCHRFSPASDCSDLENNRSCSFLRDECLDDSLDGPCRVQERIYRCPIAGGAAGEGNQYICGNDVYCINGDCEPIVREASTEFRDALVGLHALDQAGKEFDETNFKVFSGERDTCHKPVFGLINCCAGKTSGLLTAAAGGAAIAGGPAAITALATPFLALFACSQDEMKLDIRDRMGFCHEVGTYCSSSVLGICKTKRTAYCCFESKLSRVLQEQGRVQLGKPWSKPKNEQCNGFTIEEFALLDLSVMDFTDVYADFMDAAKLPDEVQTMSEIQTRIQDYYDLHGQ